MIIQNRSKYRAEKQVICLVCRGMYYNLRALKTNYLHGHQNKCNCGNSELVECKRVGSVVNAGSVKGKSVMAASKKEADFYLKLVYGEKPFLFQVPFEVALGYSMKSIKYIADFVVFGQAGDKELFLPGYEKIGYIYKGLVKSEILERIQVIDTKGMRTKLFELKAALMWERYGILIEEV